MVSVTFPIDRYNAMLAGSTATLVVLPLSLGIVKGDTLQIVEVDAINVPTGNYTQGIVTKIVAGQFFSLPSAENMYYIEQLVHFF